MESVKKSLSSCSVLMCLVAAALLAGGVPGQIRYQAVGLTSQDGALRATPRKFDEYGDIRFNDEKARLDQFAIALQNEPGARGYLIGYGGRICRAGEAKARANRARGYLIRTRGIEPERFVTLNGGYRSEVGVELYIVPLGASEPPASPTIPRCTKPVANQGRRRA